MFLNYLQTVSYFINIIKKRYIRSQKKMSSLYKHINPVKRLSTASTNDDFVIEIKRERLGSLDNNDNEELRFVHFKKHKNVSFKENFVEVIDVQNWKRYNVDVSVDKHIRIHNDNEDKCIQVKEIEPVLCNCMIM